MASTVADELLLKLNFQTIGADSVRSITGAVQQLAAEMSATGNAAQVSSVKLEVIRDQLLKVAKSFGTGSAEAISLSRAAAAVQIQLNEMGRAEQNAAKEAERLARSQQEAADAARRHREEQDRANDVLNRTRRAAQEAAQGVGQVRNTLYTLISGEIAQGIGRLVGQVRSLADEANKADTAVLVFDRTMQRFSVSTDAANATAQRLSARFGASVSEIKDSMSTLVRVGFRDMAQLEAVMTGAAASALAAGKTAVDGFDRVADAAATGLSASLNAIKISENLGPLLDKYARSLGKTADELTDVERAQVVANLVLKATATEVDALDSILNTYVLTQAEAKNEAAELRKEIGRELQPAVIALTKEVLENIRATRAWWKENKEEVGPSIKAVTIAIVDGYGAMRVMIGVIGDLAAAVGGIVTIIVGFGASVAGGFVGGLQTAVSEVQKLFKAGLDSLLAFQAAWDKLKAGDLAGARDLIVNAGRSAVGAITSAPGNILNGAQQGANFGVALMGEGWDDLASTGQRVIAATEAADASSSRIRNTLQNTEAGLGDLNSIVSGLKISGVRMSQGFGENPGKYGYGPDGHRGVDYATPMGTSLYAPVGGRLTTGNEAGGYGQYIKLIDAQGKQMILAHLSGVSQALLDEMKRGGGWANVTAGQFLGKTGNSGNSTGPHLHIEIRDKNGRVINPQGMTMPLPNPDTATPKDTRTFDQYIAEARKLLAQVERTKAGGEAANPAAWQKAAAALKAFTKDNELAAQAVAWVQSETKKAATETSKYGQTFDRLKGKLDVTQSLEKLGQNVAPQIAAIRKEAESAAAAEKKRNGETEKYRQLLGLAGDAAARLRTISDKAAQEAESAQRDADQRAERQAQLRARIADQNRQLTVQAAQQAVARTKELNSQELAAAKGTATEKLKLIQRQSQDEFDAAERLARAQRDKALRDSAQGPQQNRAGRDAQIRAEYDNAVLGALGARQKAMQAARADVAQEAKDAQTRSLALAALGLPTPDEIRRHMQGVAEATERSLETVLQVSLDVLPELRAQYAAILAMQAESNSAIATGAQEAADELLALGDTEGALSTLETALLGLMEAADQGEDAAEAINALIIAINRLTGETELNDTFNGFVAGLGGLIDDQIAQTVAYLEEVTDPKMRAKVTAFLADLRGQLPRYDDPAAGGLIPGASGFAQAGSAFDLTAYTRAQELLARMADEVDPGALTLLLAEGETFLAEFGDRLGEDVQTSLRAAFADGQNYVEVMAGVADATAQGIKDGWERGTGAAARPTNRYEELLGDVFNFGREGLADPVNLDALTGELDRARAAGELTVRELTILKGVIADLTGEVADLAADPDDTRLAQWNDRLTELEANYESGAISAKEFTAQALAALPALRALATAAKAQGKDELAGLYTLAADGLDRMIPATERAAYSQAKLKAATDELAQAQGKTKPAFQSTIDALEDLRGEAGVNQVELEKLIAKFKELQDQAARTTELEKLTAGIQKLSSALAGVFKTFGGEGAGVIVGEVGNIIAAASQAGAALGDVQSKWAAFKSRPGAGNLGDLLGSLGGAVGVAGAVVSAVVNIGNAIEDMNGGLRQWKKGLLEVADAQKKVAGDNVGLFKNPYAAGLQEDAGNREKLAGSKWYQRLWWGMTGQTPQVLDDATAKMKISAAQAFQDLAGSLQNTLQGSLMDVWRTGDWSGVSEAWAKSLDEFVVKAAIDRLIQTSGLETYIQAYADAVAAGLDPAQALAELRAELERLKAEAQGVLQGLPTSGDGGAAARRAAEQALSLQEAQNKLLYTQGLRSQAEYEAERLRLSLERIRLQMEAELARLAAEGASEEELARIRQMYLLQGQQEQADYDAARRAAAERLAKDLTGLTLNNAETALNLEERLALSLATTEEQKYQIQREYAEKRLRLTLARIAAEEAAELASVDTTLEGAEAMLAAIREKYSLARDVAQAELTLMDREQAARVAGLVRGADEVRSAWAGALSGGVSAFLSGEGSGLTQLYQGVRDRLIQAVQEGLTVRRITERFTPILDQITGALNGGQDALAARLIGQITAQAPSVALEYQTALGPLLSAINPLTQAIQGQTRATNANTEALSRGYGTTVVSFGRPVNDDLRLALARYA